MKFDSAGDTVSLARETTAGARLRLNSIVSVFSPPPPSLPPSRPRYPAGTADCDANEKGRGFYADVGFKRVGDASRSLLRWKNRSRNARKRAEAAG